MRVVSGDDEATHGVAECAGRAKHMIYVARDGTGEVGRGDAFLSFCPGPQYMLIMSEALHWRWHRQRGSAGQGVPTTGGDAPQH